MEKCCTMMHSCSDEMQISFLNITFKNIYFLLAAQVVLVLTTPLANYYYNNYYYFTFYCIINACPVICVHNREVSGYLLQAMKSMCVWDIVFGLFDVL